MLETYLRAGEQCVGGNGVRPMMAKAGGRRREEEESALNLNSTSTATRIYRPSECK